KCDQISFSSSLLNLVILSPQVRRLCLIYGFLELDHYFIWQFVLRQIIQKCIPKWEFSRVFEITQTQKSSLFFLSCSVLNYILKKIHHQLLRDIGFGQKI